MVGVVVIGLIMQVGRWGGFPYAYQEVSYDYYVATNETGISGDEEGAWVQLPFTFQYDGQSFDSVFITTNGYISFNSSVIAPYPQNFPDPNLPNGVVAPFWQDYVVYSGGSIKTATYGYAPYRYFVIEWDSVYTYGGDPSLRYRFEVVLFENGGNGDSIMFSYFMIPEIDSGWNAGVGLESLNGSGGVMYCYQGAPNLVYTGLTIVFHRVEVGNDCAALGVIEPAYTYGTGEEVIPYVAVENNSTSSQDRYVHLIAKEVGSGNIIYSDSQYITMPADTYSYATLNLLTFPAQPCTLELTLYLSPEDGYASNDTVRDTVIVLPSADTTDTYIMYDLGPVDFVDISSNYDTVIKPGLDGGARVSLPFTFPYYDTSYTSYYVGINGGICFNEDTVDGCNSSLFWMFGEDFLAVFWEDWAGSDNPSAVDSVIYIKNFGNDSVVIMWRNVRDQFYGIGPFNFEAILYPDGGIKFIYDIKMRYFVNYDLTIGIVSRNGAPVQYTYNEEPWVPNWWYPHGIYFEVNPDRVIERHVYAENYLKGLVNGVYYSLPYGRKGMIEIYSIDGRKVSSRKVEGKGILRVERLQNGVYIAVLRVDRRIISRKFMVVK